MTRLRHLFAMMLLVGCASEGPERVVEPRTTDAPADRGVAMLRKVMIDGHARERTTVGVPMLVWDDTLADHARAYAEEMTRTRRFAHSTQPQGPAREGENLWTGTRGDYSYAEMFGHWAAEKRDFVNGVSPAFSRTGRWQDASHYAQIVWRASTRMGCAMASSTTDDYLVCRYSPTGVVVGQKAF